MVTQEQKMAVLEKIAGRMNEAGVLWCVGASLDLYFHGLTDHFHDIDIMTGTDGISAVIRIMDGLGTRQPASPDGKYKTKYFLEYIVEDVEVDIMAGFAIVADGTEHDCSLTHDQIEKQITVGREEVPLQRLGLWKRYYRLMGRTDKVRLLEAVDEL